MAIGIKIIYEESYIKELKQAFLTKFNSLPGTKRERILKTDISMTTYLCLFKNSTLRKKSIEAMRTFLENRSPKYDGVSMNEIWCSGCEEIIPQLYQASLYHCLNCVSPTGPNIVMTSYANNSAIPNSFVAPN